MADKIMSLKVTQSAGSFGNEIPIGCKAADVEVTLASGSTASLSNVLGSSKTGGGGLEGRLTTAETKLSGIDSGANKTTVDSSLSSISTNPVQNKVINAALSNKANSSALSSYLPLTGGTISGNLTVTGRVRSESIKTTYLGAEERITGTSSSATLSIAPLLNSSPSVVSITQNYDASEDSYVGVVTMDSSLCINGGLQSDNLEIYGYPSTGGYLDFHTTKGSSSEWVDFNGRILVENDSSMHLYATSSAGTQGSIYIHSAGSVKGSQLNDWVIAEGISSDNMFWRKWASGWAECWGGFNVDTFSSVGNIKYLSRSFPFTFSHVWVGLATDGTSNSADSKSTAYATSVRATTNTSFTLAIDKAASGVFVQCYFAGKY